MVKWSVPIALEMGFEYQAQPRSTEWYKSRLRGNQAKHLSFTEAKNFIGETDEYQRINKKGFTK